MKKTKFLFTLVTATGIVFSITSRLTSCSWYEGSKIRLVTDGGFITDKSFNESGYDSVGDLNDLKKPSAKFYTRPNTSIASDIANGYRASEATGARYILAPGFNHIAAIKQYLSAVPNSKLKWILIDGDGELQSPSIHNLIKNRVATDIFDMKSAAYLSGFRTAYNLQSYSDAHPKVGTYGGGPFPGVTDYMVGWLNGVKDANTYNETVLKNSVWKDIGIAKFPKYNDYTNTDFSNSDLAIARTNYLIQHGAKGIMPVAGNEVNQTVSISSKIDASERPFVIGVDTDMSKTIPDYSNMFFQSILKNVTYALDAMYIKNVLHVDVIKSNTAAAQKLVEDQKSIRGFYSRFGSNDDFANNGEIDLTHSNIKQFGFSTIGTKDNHFTGVTHAVWRNSKVKDMFDTKAVSYMNDRDTYVVGKGTQTKWEAEWLKDNPKYKSLTWNAFLQVTIENWK